jgi:HK97 family phage portal protein
MGILSRLESRLAASATQALDDKWYLPGGYFYGGTGPLTKSGTTVSELSAMQLAIVWCAIRILSEDTSSLPLKFYKRRKSGGKDEAIDDYRYHLVGTEPNSEQCSMVFRETQNAHIFSWGNSYAEIQYGKGLIGKTTPIGLWPIAPHRVTPFRTPEKELMYKIQMPGQVAPLVLPKERILHVPGLGYDGIVGYSPIGWHKETVGQGIALSEFSSLYFGQGSHPGVIVSHPESIGDEAWDHLQASLNKEYSGLGKSHRLMLLEEGMKIEHIGIPNDQSQFLESRKYNNVDIGTRIFRIPPYMYGEMDKTAYKNVEQQALDYVIKTLRPWLVRIESVYNLAFVPREERDLYFFKHDIDELLVGDFKTRQEGMAVGRQWGYYSADDCREKNGDNPLPDNQGKIYLIPKNMIDATKVNDPAFNGVKQPKLGQPTHTTDPNSVRARIDDGFLPSFADALGRIVRKESQRVRFLRGKDQRDIALDEFYGDFPAYMVQHLFPVCESYLNTLATVARDIMGASSTKTDVDKFLPSFLSEYTGGYVRGARMVDDPMDIQDRDVKAIARAIIIQLGTEFLSAIGVKGV